MFDSLSISTNSAISSLEMIDYLTSNIVNGDTPGYNGKRFSFRDYLQGGTIESSGNSWRQGSKIVRVGEPTKMMISGKGLFSLVNPNTNEIVYTRLGDFHFDRNGYLTTEDGFMLLGTPLQSNLQPTNNPNKIVVGPDYEINGFKDPFVNPANLNIPKVNAGETTGGPHPVNLAIDPTNGLYLGKYSKLRIDQNGVIWGKYGNTEISLYKVSVRAFQNYNGLKSFRDVYWRETGESGPPLPCNSKVFNEALEKSNVWAKIEVDYMVEAQRQYAAAINTHKVADRLLQQAIELVG